MTTERLIFTRAPRPWLEFFQGAACGLAIGLTCWLAGYLA